MLKFNNKELTDFNVGILADLTFSAPEQDIEFVEIKGLDGDLAISNDRLKSFDRSFPFVMNSQDSIETDFGQLTDFLLSSPGWHQLEWVGSPDHIYTAMYFEQSDMSRIVRTLGKGVLNFRMKPTKKLKTGLKEVSLDSSITNPTNRASKPLITIKGNGNMSLQIGKHKLDLKNVDSGLIIDVETGSATDLTGKRNQYDKVVNYPFPVIEPGKQTILKTGNITSVTVIPRWEVVAT